MNIQQRDANLKESIQQDLLALLDGLPQEAQTRACQIVVDNFKRFPIKEDSLTEEQEKKAGELLAVYLGLQKSEEHSDRYDLPDGNKTAAGVWRTLYSRVLDCAAGDFSRLE